MTKLRRRLVARRLALDDPTAWKTRRYERTRRRVVAGALARPAAFRTWSWVSTGRACDGCGEMVGAAEIEHDVDVDGAIVLRLHAECFSACFER
jgi:hypothetical protein